MPMVFTDGWTDDDDDDGGGGGGDAEIGRRRRTIAVNLRAWLHRVDLMYECARTQCGWCAGLMKIGGIFCPAGAHNACALVCAIVHCVCVLARCLRKMILACLLCVIDN